MRRVALALALVVSTMPGVAVTPLAANVFAADGIDPRRYVDAEPSPGDPALPIATVTSEFTLRNTGGMGGVPPGEGTAFMVSPCYAMTSYHVLFGTLPLTLDAMASYPVSLRFGGTDRPSSIVKGRVRLWGAAMGQQPDVALLLLDRCPGRTIGWLDLAPAGDAPTTRATVVAMPSFSVDRSMRRLSIQRACRSYGIVRPRNWLLHDCASREGASGSPLLAHESGVTVVVGVNAGELDPEGGVLRRFDARHANWAVPAETILRTARLAGILRRDRARNGAANPFDVGSASANRRP